MGRGTGVAPSIYANPADLCLQHGFADPKHVAMLLAAAPSVWQPTHRVPPALIFVVPSRSNFQRPTRRAVAGRRALRHRIISCARTWRRPLSGPRVERGRAKVLGLDSD